MEDAIRSNDWYEVGEILKKCIQTHEFTQDLAQLSIHMYKVDPEVLTTYFISAPLPAEKRAELHQKIQKVVKSNPVSCDILKVSEFYHSDDESELEKLEPLSKSVVSTTARFYAYCGLVKLQMKLMKTEEVYKYFKQALAVVNDKDFLKYELQKYIDAAFCIAIICPTADMFCFQFCADLLSPEARDLYALMTEGCAQREARAFKTTDYWEHEVVATAEDVHYHQQVHAMQLYLLQTPLHERAQVPYDDLKQVLNIQDDIELEQLTASLVLQGTITGRADSVHRTIQVEHVKPVSGNKEIKRVLIERLNEWIERIRECHGMFDHVLRVEE